MATEIVSQTVLTSWLYYVVLACLTILTAGAGGFFGGYLKRRAEHAAIHADFESLKQQLRETTSVTESIKAEIQRMSERSEKLRWQKQEKLEKYITTTLGTVDWYSRDVQHRFFDAEAPSEVDPYRTASMLQSLYLPELAIVHAAFVSHIGGFQGWVVEGMKQRAEIFRRTGSKGSPSSEHCAMYSGHLAKMNAAVQGIEQAAQALARELTKV
ncbi:MAG: hypothetical protein H7238_04480 [Polaromonas sp.]|nr:hypothetical protein [Polaromonas sp.]